MHRIKQPWGSIRLLRMAIALILIYDGWKGETWWVLALGAVLVYQAVMNTGCGPCMASEGCKTSASASDTDSQDIEIEYKEIK